MIYNTINDAQDCLLIIMITFGIIAIGALYIFFEKELVLPLNRLQEMAKELQDGSKDLTKRITIKREDEVGIASSYINAFIHAIQNTIYISKSVSIDNKQTTLKLLNIANTLPSNSDNQFKLVNSANNLTQEISKNLDIATHNTDSTINDIQDTEATLCEFIKTARLY